MRIVLTLAFVALVNLAWGQIRKPDSLIGPKKTTATRIGDYNYPVETHYAETTDGYVLTMFRIPYSPKLQNKHEYRPVAFLQHGLISSSDCWILNGPDNALAYVLADAGYDVWIGNARGNTYSKKNIYVKPILPSFWDFSWNEIAIYDMPAMIDYSLEYTNQSALHYVGHSQGTTVFFVLLSLIPSYNDKIKTSHMFAPVVFMNHLESPLVKAVAPFIGKPSVLSELIGSNVFAPSVKLTSMLESKACRNESIFQPICANILFLAAGWDSKHLNYTLLPDVVETHPAGSSTSQVIHYVQEYKSGYFRKYDYKEKKNLKVYGQSSPPSYKLGNVVAPVRLYYGANDFFASVIDVNRLIHLLPNLVYNFYVPIPEFNHLDFLWALEVKDLLYDKVIAAANYYEETGEQWQ